MNDFDRHPLSVEADGLLDAWISLSIGLAERTAHGTFGWARDVANESSTLVDATLGWLDTASHSTIKIGRLGVRHVGHWCHDVIDFGEHCIMQTIHAIGSLGRETTALASRTSSEKTHHAPAALA